MRIALVIGLVWGFSTLSAPSGTTPTPQKVVDPPVLSTAGMKRVLENLAVLDENIRTTQSNIRNSEKNAQTIETELKTLDAFVQEHAELRKKYNNYLTHAFQMVKKNEQGRKALAKFEKGTKEQAATAKKEAKEKDSEQLSNKGRELAELDAARREITDREKWDEDANSKITRVQALLKGLDQNLQDIETRRTLLKDQYVEWTKRIKEFQLLLPPMLERKSEMEKLARRAAQNRDDE